MYCELIVNSKRKRSTNIETETETELILIDNRTEKTISSVKIPESKRGTKDIVIGSETATTTNTNTYEGKFFAEIN